MEERGKQKMYKYVATQEKRKRKKFVEHKRSSTQDRATFCRPLTWLVHCLRTY